MQRNPNLIYFDLLLLNVKVDFSNMSPIDIIISDEGSTNFFMDC